MRVQFAAWVAQRWVGNALKGRGALTNPAGRFERTGVEEFHDGWYEEEQATLARDSPSRRTARSTSSRRTIRRTSVSTTRSIPIVAASTAASTAMPGPSHAYMGLVRRHRLRNEAFLQGERRRRCWSRSSRSRATCASRSCSARTPIPISRSSRRCASRARSSRCCARTRHPVSIITKSAMVSAGYGSADRSRQRRARDGVHQHHHAEQ